MILWINGTFGAGKTTVAYELKRRLENAYVYDPENIGYFLFQNTPPQCHGADFQDIPLWREFNGKTLKLIEETYPGVILVPMTINEGQYYNEIIGKLTEEGVPVRHVILCADRETILKRLKRRSLGRLSKEEFAVRAMEKSFTFFEGRGEEEKIFTDHLTVDQVVEQVAARCGLTLPTDHRGRIGKALDRERVALEHIRR